MILQNAIHSLRQLSWKLGDFFNGYYGPLIWLSGLLFLMTGAAFFLIVMGIFAAVFILRAALIKGQIGQALLWPPISKKQKAVPLVLKDGSVADLYLNKNPNAPCLVFLFGGGFISGNPQQYSLLNAEWIRLGFHVIQVPYSYWPEAQLDQCLKSLLGRLKYILDYRTDVFSPQGFVLGGRSAGGYLAYHVSAQISDPKLKAVLGFYPVVQPQVWKKEWPSRFIFPTEKIYERFFLHQTSPADLLSISSYAHSREYWLITGSWDPVVRPHHSRQLAEHLKSIGCKVHLFEIPTELHGFECNPNSFGGQKALSLLGQHFSAITGQSSAT